MQKPARKRGRSDQLALYALAYARAFATVLMRPTPFMSRRNRIRPRRLFLCNFDLGLLLERGAFGHRQRSRHDRSARFGFECILPVARRFLHYLVLQHRDRMDKHFGPRWTTRN